MKFDELLISNFRGIDRAELKELKSVNLIVGQNNSGKTSILEAIFLLSGMSNPELLQIINDTRGVQLKNDNDFKYIFNNLNLKQPISLSGIVSGIKRSAKIFFYKDNKQSINPFMSPSDSFRAELLSLQNQIKDIDGLKISFKNDDEDEQDVYISLKNHSIELSKTYKEALTLKYLNSQSNLNGRGIKLSPIIKKKKTRDIVDILRQIEPNLKDIQILENNSIYCDIGEEELLPISIMGDGFIKTLAVLSSMYEIQSGVLLIDEIENGLHYSSLAVFWKAIIMLSKQLGVQVIATTHSYEALGVLSDVIQELNEKEIAMYRIEKQDNNTNIIHYTNQDFIISLDENYEVR